MLVTLFALPSPLVVRAWPTVRRQITFGQVHKEGDKRFWRLVKGYNYVEEVHRVGRRLVTANVEFSGPRRRFAGTQGWTSMAPAQFANAAALQAADATDAAVRR